MIKPNLRLRPSRTLAAWLMLIHGGALLCLLVVHIAWWINLLVGVLVVVSFVLTYWRYVILRHPQSIIALSVGENGNWTLKLRAGEVLAARLQGNSVTTNMLLILNFREDKKKRHLTVLLCPDAVGTENYRQLRAWLEQKGV